MVTEITVANGWVPEPSSNEVLTKDYAPSIVEQVGRKVRMTSPTMRIPRFAQSGADIVPEHGVIPLIDAELDEVVMAAHKWANRFAISVEGSRDAVVDVLNQQKLAWLNSYAAELDHAALGVTGTGGPFESVYRVATSAGRVSTAGALEYEDLVDTFGALEGNKYGSNLVVIAHPAFKMQMRNLKDADGIRVVDNPLGEGVPTIFGNPIYFTYGATAAAAVSDEPTGNPLLIVANRQHLVVGVLDGPESEVSREARWETDGIELKMRARRGFVAATPEAFRVVELTEAP